MLDTRPYQRGATLMRAQTAAVADCRTPSDAPRTPAKAVSFPYIFHRFI